MRRALSMLIVAIYSAAVLAHGEKHAVIDYSKAEETEFGRAADPRNAKRTIRVEMSDRMRFTPALITVKQGETVRFIIKNNGKTMHEMVLGTMKELKEHAELMKKHPGMEHDEPYMAHVAPGKTETIVWQFTKPGEFHFGCLVPGHFEAGMVGQINVSTKGNRR